MADNAYRVVHRHATVNHWLAPRGFTSSSGVSSNKLGAWALSARADSGWSCAVVGAMFAVSGAAGTKAEHG